MDDLFPTFIFLRPVYITFIVALVLVLLIVVLQRKNLLNLFSIFSISAICSCVSAVTLYSSGYIVDEYNLGGDEVSFYMFLAIVGLSMLNVIIYHIRNMRKLKLEGIKYFLQSKTKNG